MSTIAQEFFSRLARIPTHGLGLSVDVYSPNLFDLLDALRARHVPYRYLEIFKASPSALAEVRRRVPQVPLAYHAEGLWLTQPDWRSRNITQDEIAEVASHLATLGCYWMNHECASKQMAGVSFGTYLPPLFIAASAAVTATHAVHLQQTLDESKQFAGRHEPLVLLEIPPLTYFAFGDLPVTEFFQQIADRAPCGFVFDLGHVWTYYRYSPAWRDQSVADFLADFLDAFPLDRVVEIHIAGLALHECDAAPSGESPYHSEPLRWLDAHHAPIPDVLWDMLDQVLSHPRLRSLKGVALEVDTKTISHIVDELTYAHARFGDRLNTLFDDHAAASISERAEPYAAFRTRSPDVSEESLDALRSAYDRYARVASGRIAQSEATLPSLWMEPGNLGLYRRVYLPHEILTWGGDVRQMFPDTCRQLVDRGIDVSMFVEFWFRQPCVLDESYDFFRLKLDRFPEFVRDVLPEAAATAAGEAEELRNAYASACDAVVIS